MFPNTYCGCPMVNYGPAMPTFCGATYMIFMSILEQYMNSRCDLVDPCNRIKNRHHVDNSYDFVVVGGGTAGSVVAARLTENPKWKVLLIEAGGDEPPVSSVPAWFAAYWGRSDTDWNYYTEPQSKACLKTDGVCYWPRGKMLGGTSVINGMMYIRGHRDDYDSWARNGATGWSWEDVLPYFLKSEDNKEIGTVVAAENHGVGGPLPVQRFPYAPQFIKDLVNASTELGYAPSNDLNIENTTGFTIAQTYNNYGSRFSTARAYLRPASKRSNLHVVYNALVTKIKISTKSRQISGVEYIKKGKKKTISVKKEIILSGGTINSPQILLLSGIGPRKTLERFNIPVLQDLPGVGQHLLNHVGLSLDFTLTKEPDVPELTWSTALEYLRHRTGPLSATGLSQGVGLANSPFAAAHGRQPDIQYFFYGYSASCSNGNVDPESLKNRRHIIISPIALQPRSKGYLTLKSANPSDPPVLQPNYFDDAHELNVLVEASKLAYRLANTMALAVEALNWLFNRELTISLHDQLLRNKYGIEPTKGYASECGDSVSPNEEFFRCVAQRYTEPENHQVGTCKMGSSDDTMAVVDPELRVYGVKGLRVIDASVMPNLPTGNTQAPVIMIAERGADFIKNTYQ